MLKKVLFITIVAVFLDLGIHSVIGHLSIVRACSCVQKSRSQELEESAAIFEGVVAEIQDDSGDKQKSSPNVAQQRVVFKVVRSWKGIQKESVSVSTAKSETECGYAFLKGKSYLVFATSNKNSLRVSSCSSTKSINDASEDLLALGIGEVPVDVELTEQEKKVFDSRKAKSTNSGGDGGCEISKGENHSRGPLLLTLLVIGCLFSRKVLG